MLLSMQNVFYIFLLIFNAKDFLLFYLTIFHLGSSLSFHPRKISDEPDAVHMSTLQNCDPHMHRLQRQDAKSRKTFKIKRHRSTIKNSMTRSATVKGGTKYHAMLLEGSQEQSVTEPDPVEPESEESPGLARCIVPNASIKRKMGITSATDLEMQPVGSEVPTQNDQATEGETSKASKVGYCQCCKHLLGNFVLSVQRVMQRICGQIFNTKPRFSSKVLPYHP